MSVQLKLTLFDIFVGDKSAHSISQCMPSSSVLLKQQSMNKARVTSKDTGSDRSGSPQKICFCEKKSQKSKNSSSSVVKLSSSTGTTKTPMSAVVHAPTTAF